MANKRHRARTEIKDVIKTAVPAGERPQYKQGQNAPQCSSIGKDATRHRLKDWKEAVGGQKRR